MFKPPVELHCLYTLEEPTLESYSKEHSLGTYVKSGKLKVGIFQATLDELNCEIRNGDYLGIIASDSVMQYFVVTNDGRNNFANGHTTYGYKSAYRTIEAAPVSDESEFKGK